MMPFEPDICPGKADQTTRSLLSADPECRLRPAQEPEADPDARAGSEHRCGSFSSR